MNYNEARPFWIRQAAQVARACCKEIFSKYHSNVVRTDCMSVKGYNGNREKEAKIVFRFENGIVKLMSKNP